MDHYTDEELLEQFGKAENRNYVFNLIVRKHQEQLYFYARRIVISHELANDVLQNAFVKAWQKLSEFRGDAALFTWLYRIVTNEALTVLRKEKKRLHISIEDLQQTLANSLESDVYYDGDEQRALLDKAVLTLPEKQRLVFTLKYFEEKKYHEISEILGTSEGALKASYHHAVKKIEDFLKSN